MFSEFEHMENHYNLDKICNFTELDSEMLYVASEKIHGTNYSFIANSDNVIPCKRHSTLTPEASFFGHSGVYQKYLQDVCLIYNILKESKPDIIQIQIYGELFGGLFDGKTAKNNSKIQAKTSYCPNNEFMAYDIKITMSDKTVTYMDWEELIEFFANPLINIKLVPIIAIDKLNNLLNLSPIFESNVPNQLGLPNPKEPFYAEGFVIRPIKEIKMPHIHSVSENNRMIFKFKNPSFLESAEPNPKNVTDIKTKKISHVEIISTYINFNRYQNVRSKLTDDELSKINDIYLADVMTDFLMDYPDIRTDTKQQQICKNICIQLIKKLMPSFENNPF
jgi:Rnl2 family RNA ligase